jgi:hypothetical protein
MMAKAGSIRILLANGTTKGAKWRSGRSLRAGPLCKELRKSV